MLVQPGIDFNPGELKDFFQQYEKFNWKALAAKNGPEAFDARLAFLYRMIGKRHVRWLADEKFGIFLNDRTLDLYDEAGDAIFRGTEDYLQRFMDRYTLPRPKVKEDFLTAREELVHTTNWSYDSNDLVGVLQGEDLASARNLDLQPSAVGLAPDYRSVHGETLGREIPIIYQDDIANANIRIKMSGNQLEDTKRAFREIEQEDQFRKVVGDSGRIKGDYVLHHLDDYDPATGLCTVQIVLRPFHDGIKHTGGVKLWSIAWNINGYGKNITKLENLVGSLLDL